MDNMPHDIDHLDLGQYYSVSLDSFAGWTQTACIWPAVKRVACRNVELTENECVQKLSFRSRLDADLLFLDECRAVWHDSFNWLSRTRAFCATVESLSANGSIVTEKVSKPDSGSIMKKRQKHGIFNVVRFPPTPHAFGTSA